MKTVYLAGGCFWCISSVYTSMKGVIDVVSGYSGGETANPTYDDVKMQKTNHRETIKVIFDDTVVSYEKILNVFYSSVDPFDDGGQFIDRGRSYTLAIYYQDDAEREFAEEFLQKKQECTDRKICISLEKFRSFYDAEEHHQRYSEKNVETFREELKASGRLK